MSIWKDEQGRLHVGIMAGGKRVHRRLEAGASKGDAKTLESELRRAMGRKQTHIPGDPMMPEVIDLYLEHAKTLRSPETAKHHAVRAVAWLTKTRASDVQAAIDTMIEGMRGHYQPATINRSIGTIKTALTLAYRKGIIPQDYGDKLRRLPENNARHVYLSIAQVQAVADAASEQVRAAIWIALLTGCRRGEILKLRPDDVGVDTIRIRSGNTKTLRERTVPIVPALRPWLQFVPLAINFEGLKTGFGRARLTAKLPDVTFHDLRHSCASLLINMGVALEVIRDILGHSSVRTTERYSHLVIDRQAKAMGKLSRAVKKAGVNRV